MNISGLSTKISKEFSMPKRDAKRILIFILDAIIEEIRKNSRVYFRGFGSFIKELKPARGYRDPVTGKMKRSPEDLRVRFRAFFEL